MEEKHFFSLIQKNHRLNSLLKSLMDIALEYPEASTSIKMEIIKQIEWIFQKDH